MAKCRPSDPDSGTLLVDRLLDVLEGSWLAVWQVAPRLWQRLSFGLLGLSSEEIFSERQTRHSSFRAHFDVILEIVIIGAVERGGGTRKYTTQAPLQHSIMPVKRTNSMIKG